MLGIILQIIMLIILTEITWSGADIRFVVFIGILYLAIAIQSKE